MIIFNDFPSPRQSTGVGNGIILSRWYGSITPEGKSAIPYYADTTKMTINGKIYALDNGAVFLVRDTGDSFTVKQVDITLQEFDDLMDQDEWDELKQVFQKRIQDESYVAANIEIFRITAILKSQLEIEIPKE